MSREIFTTVPAANVKKSGFDLSHNRKISCKIGELVPVLCQECIPGDTWKINSEVFARLAPLVSPVMHKINIYLHGFFVPMRILHDKLQGEDKESWEKFITGQTALPDSTTVPVGELNQNVPYGGLSDHLGIPPGNWNTMDEEYINVMPHAAYHMIWSDYYRDENLETEFDWKAFALKNALVIAPLKMRAWEKDYFTSCWPWAQKGVASAAIVDTALDAPSVVQAVGGGHVTDGDLKTTSDVLKSATNQSAVLVSELSLDIQELRRANKMQIWMERTARAGSRLNEFLKGHFGVWPRDERLQRPEYIGGGVFPFVISDVVNTAGFVPGIEPPETQMSPVPVGTMAGKGTSYGTTNGMFKQVDEHGYIMIIMSIRPESVYYQGLPRMFSRKLYLDFPFPEFADMGEQEVLNKEIYLKNAQTGINNTFFGYQSMYADFKFIPNSLHGEFRSTLEHWTMARKFADTPDLNEDFIHIDEINDDLERVFAVQGVEHVYAQIGHRISCMRPLPFFNIPSLE